MKEIARRKLDELGRFVLPMDVRTKLEIDAKDELCICIDGESVVLKKAQVSCLMCKNTDDLTFIDSKPLCFECIAKIKKRHNTKPFPCLRKV